MATPSIKIVKVDWQDITSHSGWHLAEDNSLLNITSVGFLIAANKHGIIIAQSLSPENDRVAESLTIPRSVITKIITISRVKLKDGAYK